MANERNILVSPYELTHEVEVPLGVGQNPTTDVFVVDVLDDTDRGRRPRAKKVTGDPPGYHERHAPVDPNIG